MLMNAIQAEKQMNSAEKNAFFYLHSAPSMAPYLDLGVWVMYPHATFKLNYCNTLCMGLPLKMAQKVQPAWNV